MRTRLSGRVLLTLLTTAMTTAAVMLIIAATRQMLADAYADAIPETASAAWTVGVLLIGLTALATWVMAGKLLDPLHDLRRDLFLAARERAIAEPRMGEPSEIHALRTAMLSVVTDLHVRIRMAEAEQHRMLRLFENISEGILQLGPGGRFVHVNATARALLGLPQLPEGQTAASLIRNIELRTLIERTLQGDVVAPAEIVVDGRQLFVRPQSMPGRFAEGPGTVITVVDLTELRRIESVRRDFVANVSHELKTPLTSIRGYAETLLTEDLPREMQTHFLEVIHKNATRIHRIVDDLLDLSRLQSGGWQPDLQEVETAALARDVWSSCEERADQKAIDFAIEGGPAYVNADPGGLRQVFSNLFDNAIRYTPNGGRVRVRIAQSNGNAPASVDIEIRDNGIGIPGDELPRIFERFYRVDPARSRADGGTGLGLSIVKHLVESMAGEVSADSELGKGTSIQVRLPAARDV